MENEVTIGPGETMEEAIMKAIQKTVAMKEVKLRTPFMQEDQTKRTKTTIQIETRMDVDELLTEVIENATQELPNKNGSNIDIQRKSGKKEKRTKQ